MHHFKFFSTYTKKKKCENFCEDVVKLSTVDDQVDDNETKIYGHEEIEVRTSFAIFLQKMIPQFEAEVSLFFVCKNPLFLLLLKAFT